VSVPWSRPTRAPAWCQERRSGSDAWASQVPAILEACTRAKRNATCGGGPFVRQGESVRPSLPLTFPVNPVTCRPHPAPYPGVMHGHVLSEGVLRRSCTMTPATSRLFPVCFFFSASGLSYTSFAFSPLGGQVANGTVTVTVERDQHRQPRRRRCRPMYVGVFPAQRGPERRTIAAFAMCPPPLNPGQTNGSFTPDDPVRSAYWTPHPRPGGWPAALPHQRRLTAHGTCH